MTTAYGLWTNSYAAVPHLINYQGRLTDSGGIPLKGTYSITFRIYDAEAAGSLLWEETQSVVVEKGIFNVLLGSSTALNLAFDKPYFLEIKVGSEVMSPRQRITSSGYAIRAETADAADRIKAASNDPAAGYLNQKVDNTTIEVVNNRLQVKNKGINSLQITGTFGDWSARGFNTVYRADTDGFVIAYNIAPGSQNGIEILSDAANPPSTRRAFVTCGNLGVEMYITTMSPVKKGDYYKVGRETGSGNVYWIPVGS